MNIKEQAIAIEKNLTEEKKAERIEKLNAKLKQCQKVASENKMHWVCVASIDVITGDIQFRTMYFDWFSDQEVAMHQLCREYEDSGVTYHIYCD